MAKIKVKDIKPTGADLFDDSESFMNELSNDELEQAMGGRSIIGPVFSIQKSCNCFPTIGGTTKTTICTLPHTAVIL